MYVRPRPSRTNPAFLYDIVGRDIEDDVAKCFDNATTCPNSGSTVVTWVPAKSTAYTPTSKIASVTDADGRMTSYAYDDADRPLRTVDPIGRQVRTVFDAAGQMSKEIHDWHSGTGCAVSGTLQECYATYTWGNDGEKLSVMDANGAVATVHYNTAYLYDGFNRLNLTTFPDGSTEQIPLVGGYDANGNILTRITRAGQTMTYTYDNLDRMLTKLMPAAGTIPAVTTTWSYYLNGAISDLADSAGNNLNTFNTTGNTYYDTAGRLVRTDTTIPGIATPLTTNYVLDANANRTKLTWPDGYYVTYGYDALNRMTTANESGTTTLGTYTYDAMSRRTNMAYRAGMNSAYTYTDAGDLTALNIDAATSGTVPHYTLGYTNAHQLNSEASSLSTYVWQPSTTGTDAYTAANNLNQYPSWTPQGSSSQNFTYDLNGNMTGGTIGGSAWTFAYDPENRLVTANKTAGGTVAALYAYDPLGRRNAKSGTGVTTTYFVDDGTDEIVEYNTSGAATTRYVPGPAINQPIAKIVVSSGARNYFQTDHHGSTIAVGNSSGAEIDGPFLYDSYGNCFEGTAPCSTVSGVPYKYAGMRLDAETGLYFDRARFYSSIVGRFLQTDPVGYSTDLNLYTYAGNDPTDKLDPTGEAAWVISRRVYQEKMGIRIPVGNHVFVVVADKYGAPPRAQFDYGPDDRSGRLVELHGNPSNFTTKTDTDAYKGLDSTANVAPINASDANVIAAGNKMDRELGTPARPGDVSYNYDPSGPHEGNSNSAAAEVDNSAQQASHPGSQPAEPPPSFFGALGWHHTFTPNPPAKKQCEVKTGSRIPVCTGG